MNKGGFMLQKMKPVVVCFLLVLCIVPVHAIAESAVEVNETQVAVTLPHGGELEDAELLSVEGEIVFLLGLAIVTLAGAVAGGGVAAVYENWFDEDYGIDRDDWRQIGFGTLSGAMCAASGGVVGHYVGPF
jgi:hypothetical protein